MLWGKEAFAEQEYWLSEFTQTEDHSNEICRMRIEGTKEVTDCSDDYSHDNYYSVFFPATVYRHLAQ